MSSVHELSLSIVEDRDLARAGSGSSLDSAQVAGWDATIADSKCSAEDVRASLCAHAVAHKSYVSGIRPHDDNGDDDDDWIAWSRSLAPHRVCSVVSNRDGSVIAAATDGGTVSILRGRDGTVLATRRVAPEGCRIPAKMFFVGGTQSGPVGQQDSLVIEPPDGGSLIVVSNIQGQKLNSANEGLMSDATRNMTIRALSLRSDDIRALNGCYLAETDIIRLVIVDHDDTVSIHDYSLPTGILEVVKKQVELSENGQPSNGDWTIDFDVGIITQTSDDRGNFAIFVAYDGMNQTRLIWLDMDTMSLSCVSTVESEGRKRPLVLGLCPIAASSNEPSLAVAIAVRPYATSPKAEIQILQLLVDPCDIQKVALSKPHNVYKVLLPDSLQAVAIAPIQSSAGVARYSVRFKTWHGSDKHLCHNFISSSYLLGKSVGELRILLNRFLFDDAQEMMSDEEVANSLQDEYASFHRSEIPLGRLVQILSSDRATSNHALAQAADCLRELAVGAVSGDKRGVDALLTASDVVLKWPQPESLVAKPTVNQIVFALSGVISTCSKVMESGPENDSGEIAVKKAALEKRLLAMKYVKEHHVDDAFAGMMTSLVQVKSPDDLFGFFVANAHYHEAAELWRSSLKPTLSTEAIVSSILGIEDKVDPTNYASLMKDIVFPSLAINHDLLPPLLAWTCRTADSFDDDRTEFHSLDDSIFLLKLVSEATKDLCIRVHSSFSKYTPFTNKPGRLISPSSSITGLTTRSFLFPCGGSSPREQDEAFDEPTELSGPSILKFGHLQGGAQKVRLGQLASLKTDTVDEREECIDRKLNEAQFLKMARNMGLPKKIAILSTFAELGGVDYIAKELCRVFSTSAPSHEEREAAISTKLREFCDRSDLNFEVVLTQYSMELCRGKETEESAIEESASIARCCVMPKTKCQILLPTLQCAVRIYYSPAWLSKLSLEAIGWASNDPTLRSSLEESSRILHIYAIVGRYCGEGAKEMFRSNDMGHAMRLVDFVAHHYDHSLALSDTLELCKAYSRLSREEACSKLIQYGIADGNSACCCEILESLCQQDIDLALCTFKRVVMYCAQVISDCCIDIKDPNHRWTEERKDEAASVTFCLCELFPIALAHSHTMDTTPYHASSSKFERHQLEALMKEYDCIRTLQRQYGIYLFPSSMRESSNFVEEAISMFEPMVAGYRDEEFKADSSVISRMRRGCLLLAKNAPISDADLWNLAVGTTACKLVRQTKGAECVRFLDDFGALDFAMNGVATRSRLSVVLAICAKAARQVDDPSTLETMKLLMHAVSLLQDYEVLSCGADALDATSSLSGLVDSVCQVLIRADEGYGEALDVFRRMLHRSAAKKRWSHTPMEVVGPRDISETLRLSCPDLHNGWYKGDGLLLPPVESLKRCIGFCRQAMIMNSSSRMVFDEGSLGLHQFVEERGAHALALRLYCHLAVSYSCKHEDACATELLAGGVKHTTMMLAERYLGGTSNGITSGTIDSQLAHASLLCLPLKAAFKLFGSTLPTAISTRDFKRVITLSAIGTEAGSSSTEGWKRQNKFVKQCRELACRAAWWGILHKYNVPFDPSLFEKRKGDDRQNKEHLLYAASLVLPLITSLSISLSDPEKILEIASGYSATFGLRSDYPRQVYVELLLSPLPSDLVATDKQITRNIRFHHGHLEKAAAKYLSQLSSPEKRLLVLRGCVIKLENEGGTDYEHLSIALKLYLHELSIIAPSSFPEKHFFGLRTLQEERALIARRLNALEILLSYFQGKKAATRPDFSRLFLSLAVNKDEPQTKSIKSLVLGSDNKKQDGSLDPLAALVPELSSGNYSTTNTLAPLCVLLGVPPGFVHARSLVARFQRARSGKIQLPSFEGDVLPVLNKINSMADKAELVEWCSSMYTFDDDDKLQCLEQGLKFALQSSNDIELLYRRTPKEERTDKLRRMERNALDQVKRIGALKDLLANRIEVNSILTSKTSNAGFGGQTRVVKVLMSKLDEKFWSKNEFAPEHFVDTIFRQASLLAAEYSLDTQEALSVGQFRQFSLLVHRACKVVADKYSHVQIGAAARRLTRRWLFYGDSLTSENEIGEPNDQKLRQPKADNTPMPLLDIDEEETINFVMDLSSLKESEDTWNSDIGSVFSTNGTEQRLTSEEEPSILRTEGSARERSELASRRAALRIAFVMAFADQYHEVKGNDHNQNKENSEAAANRPQTLKSTSFLNTRKRELQRPSPLKTSESQDVIIEHSRELLRIVFAKSNGFDLSQDISFSTSFDSRVTDTNRPERPSKMITFAMRHRALRAASILCPQAALEEVARSEAMIGTNTLKDCTFGAFVAKEIEEMGLPLPHSDLAQLSTMHFPSYARALWRHHRDGVVGRSQGRLLLLILEMFLKDSVKDGDFLSNLLSDISRLNLPRTLLLGCECLLSFTERMGARSFAGSAADANQIISGAVSTLIQKLFAELIDVGRRGNAASDEVRAGIETLHRTNEIVKGFSHDELGVQNHLSFVERALKLSSFLPVKLRDDVIAIIVSSLQRIRDMDHLDAILRVADMLPTGVVENIRHNLKVIGKTDT